MSLLYLPLASRVAWSFQRAITACMMWEDQLSVLSNDWLHDVQDKLSVLSNGCLHDVQDKVSVLSNGCLPGIGREVHRWLDPTTEKLEESMSWPG